MSMNEILRQHRKGVILSSLIGCIILVAVLIMATGTEVYSLSISGRNAGYITDRSVVGEAVDEIVADYAGAKEPLDVTVDTAKITYEKTDLEKEEVKALTEKELKKKITESEICTVKAWAVSVDGRNIAAASSRADADQILDSVKNHYLDKESMLISAGFKESVTATKAAINLTDLMQPDDAVNLILTGAQEPKIYTVKEGDTIWDIAAAYDMSTDELQKANPGFDPDKLKIGQQLNILAMKPLVTVITKEQVTATENIAFNTVYEESDRLNKGVVKVKTPGVNGTKEVTSEIIKENGIVIASKEIKSVIITEPQNQVALKGTKSTSLYASSRGLGSSIGRVVSFAASGSDIVSYAKKFIGIPYIYGGSTPKGFDCSGFTQYVMGHFGGSIPRTTTGQYSSGTRISKSELKPGDLVFFKPSAGSSRISHVGIYTGGGKFIHSPQPGESIKISDLSSSYNLSHYYGAVRVTN